MNVERGEFILLNHTGADILSRFRQGKRPTEVVAEMGLRGSQRDDALAFVRDSLGSGLLAAHPPRRSDAETSDEDARRDYLVPGALALTLELSRRCNLACKHCYNRSGESTPQELPVETVERLLAEAHSLYGSLSTLILTGGEPFLYADLHRIVSRGIQVGFSIVRINTNGTVRPCGEMAQTLRRFSDRVEVQVTLLGGTAATHDSMASRRGSFAKTTANLPAFIETGCQVTIAYMESQEALSELEGALRLSKGLGAELKTSHVYPIGRARDDFGRFAATAEPKPSAARRRGAAYRGMTSGVIPEEKRLSLLSSFPPEAPCGKQTVAVLCDLNVVPCILLRDIVVGNVADHPLGEVLSSSDMQDFRRSVAMDSRETCAECELRYVCAERCPAVSLHFAGSLTGKSPFCDYC